MYRVTGQRDYRGHPEGMEFVALLDPKAEHRAVMRGSIERIGTTVPKPGKHRFPNGWLPTQGGNSGRA